MLRNSDLLRKTLAVFLALFLLAGSGAALAEALPAESPAEEPMDLALERLNRFADMVNEQKESSLGFLRSLKDSAA